MALVTDPLRIGFVPEHFSTPLYFAQKYFSLNARLVPFPSGTGAMIAALRAREIDVGIGLTEGWIAGLGSKRGPNGAVSREGGYSMIGTYVETPLCWAISTGANRDDIKTVEGLRGRKMGISRIGSGSHVMGFVLADQHKWLSPNPTTPPFTAHPLGDFQSLRNAVNDRTADFFMWEHFTSKRYFAPSPSAPSSQSTSPLMSTMSHTPSSAAHTSSLNTLNSPFSQASPSTLPPSSPFAHTPTDLIRKVGEIYTPWPSWHIVARHPTDARLEGFFYSLNRGIAYFETHQEEAVQYISTHLDYSREDAQSWLATVRFSKDTQGVVPDVVNMTVGVLRKAGVLVDGQQTDEISRMIAFPKGEIHGDVHMR